MEGTAPANISPAMPKICSGTASSQKEGTIVNDQLGEDFSSPTPVKTKEPSRIERIQELPRKFQILIDFFNHMISSLRLLSLRRKTPSFRNISIQVQFLTGRKFLYTHLAQIKYILPEAIQVDKILTHDETMMCMKPDMKVMLQLHIVRDHHEESIFVALSNLFSSRLRDLCIKHPKDYDIPEAELPEPFRHHNIPIMEHSIAKNSLTFCEETINSSHISLYFKRRFCQKTVVPEIEKTDLIPSNKFVCEKTEINKAVENLRPLLGMSVDNVCQRTPVKLSAESNGNNVPVGTPMPSTPVRPISPIKSVLTCEGEDKAKVRQNCKQSYSTAKKSLDFYCMEGEDTFFSPRPVSIHLSDLVLWIYQIFQSVNFCSITKEELIQKIIMDQFEIDDCSEVETQLENLQKLVPDWFHKRLAPGGDLLYYVQRVSDLNCVCERVCFV